MENSEEKYFLDCILKLGRFIISYGIYVNYQVIVLFYFSLGYFVANLIILVIFIWLSRMTK